MNEEQTNEIETNIIPITDEEQINEIETNIIPITDEEQINEIETNIIPITDEEQINEIETNIIPITDEEFKTISQNNFLVTGGAGYIGSHLCQLLVKCGAKKVYIVDDLRKENTHRRIHHLLNKDNCEFIKMDINNIEQLDEIFESEEIDYVFHFAGDIEIGSSINDPLNIIKEYKYFTKILNSSSYWCKKFIYASSSSVYGENYSDNFLNENMLCYPNTPYAANKFNCEILAQTYTKMCGYPTLGLRLFEIYGLDQRYNTNPGELEYDLPFVGNIISKAIKNKPIELDLSKNNYIHLCFIIDCVVSILKAGINNDNSMTILNIAGPKKSIINKENLVKLILELTNSKSKIININYDKLKLLINEEFKNFNNINNINTLNKINYYLADLNNMCYYTNYKPQVPLEDSLIQIIEHYKKLFEFKKNIKNQIKNQQSN
jgi:nucleoside-diphosphate-sugar epimerase